MLRLRCFWPTLACTIPTGNVDEKHIDNQRYGEIHSGDSWLPARDRFCPCKENESNMPVGLIVFEDKSHTDLHGALALTPIIFILTMFNHASRNNTRLLGYIPNLTHGKNKADRTNTSQKIQDEHNVCRWFCIHDTFAIICKNTLAFATNKRYFFSFSHRPLKHCRFSSSQMTEL